MAIPPTAATLVVLTAVKSPGPLATEIVTVEASLLTTFPYASSTSTVNGMS